MKYSFFIGRYQPLHDGHVKLIRTVLAKGERVCIALRDTEISKTDPHSIGERYEMFRKEFSKEMTLRQLIIITIPDIKEICYGRKVGWGIREIKLDSQTESISASKIRKRKN